MNIETYLDPPPLLRYIGNYIDLDWLWQHRVSPQLRTEVHHNFFFFRAGEYRFHYKSYQKRGIEYQKISKETPKTSAISNLNHNKSL